jgi:hypothetical protein
MHVPLCLPQNIGTNGNMSLRSNIESQDANYFLATLASWWNGCLHRMCVACAVAGRQRGSFAGQLWDTRGVGVRMLMHCCEMEMLGID